MCHTTILQQNNDEIEPGQANRVLQGNGLIFMEGNSCQNCFTSILKGVYSKRKESAPFVTAISLRWAGARQFG